MVYDELIKVLNKESFDDKKLEELLKNGNFSKIYAYCIKKLDNIKKDNTNSNEGIWKKYNQNGSLDLRKLTCARGLVLPKELDGNLYLNSLTSAAGLILPKKIDFLNLESLTDVEGFIIPEELNCDLLCPFAKCVKRNV